MTPGAEIKLIAEIKALRGDLNVAQNHKAGELVNLTRELFLLRKTLELLLSPAQGAELARVDPQTAPSPDLAHQAATHEPTLAEREEIERALSDGDLEVGLHGLPVRAGVR